jgi:GTP cyclohydrolase I
VEAAVREILLEIGEDPDRQGLLGTPGRVHRMYAELTAGYHVDPARLINGAIFDVDYSEMVVVKEIPFYSLCEHHLLPFFGTAAVAYIPSGRVVGLSKIPRIVEMYARRLQVQERLTSQIADFLMEHLRPQGVGIVMEATHLCAVMRGVRKPGTVMTTSHVRSEFFAHLQRPSPGA